MLVESNANLESKIAERTKEVSEVNRTLLIELERRTQTEERLRQSSEAATRANQAKTAFLVNMSHELRTPLNAILGFSEIMTNEMLGPVGNPRYKEYAGDIQRSGQFLRQLIDDLLALGAIEAGRLDIAEELCDPRAITADVMQLVEVQAAAAQIELRSQVSRAVHHLYADPRHLKQILINLIVNAVKFTEAGGRILIRWRLRQGAVELSVIDTGVGIPTQEIANVFGRYQRGDRTISRTKQGVGLGLSLVKGMADAHGAVITIKSRVHHGTDISVTFPTSRTIPDALASTRLKSA